MTLSDFLIKYRTEHNISQRQFASQCGVSNGYIAMLEKEKNPKTGQPMIPSLPYLNKIASCMGITLSDLFSMVDDMPVDVSIPDQWSIKFRESLQELLLSADGTDAREAGISLDKWRDVAYGSSPLSLEACCNICNEAGESLDEMTGLREKKATDAFCGLDEMSIKISEIILHLSPDSKKAALQYLKFLESQSES